MNRELMQRALDAIDRRFQSGNAMPVERATVLASEWAELRAALAAPAPTGFDEFIAREFRGGKIFDLDGMRLAWDAALAAPVAPAEPITVEAVAEVRRGDDGLKLDWLIEGGVDAMEPGCVLVCATRPITDDDGHGEVYTAPPEVQRDAARLDWLLFLDWLLLNVSGKEFRRIGVEYGGNACRADVDAAMASKAPT